MIKVKNVLIMAALLFPSCIYSQENSTHTAEEITTVNTQKGSDRFGKIAEELMDMVYEPAWRKGNLTMRRVAISPDYVIACRIFYDPKKINLEESAELQFKLAHKSDGISLIGTIPGQNLILCNNVTGILGVEPPEMTTLQLTPNPAPVLLKQSNPVSLVKAGVYRSWERWGKGKGVKIGIIDGGFINLEALWNEGILPRNLVHLRNPLPENLAKQYPYGTGIHGSAVAEVIHEIAPEAEIFLYPTALMSFAWDQAIDMAIQDGVHIINSSMNTTYGALDGLGTPNTYLDRAVNAGIVYVNSAGNNGASCYIGAFGDADGDFWHDFSPDDEGNAITLNKGDQMTATLTWDDYGSDPAHPNSDQDLDLYLFYLDASTGQTIQAGQSLNAQSAESDTPYAPMERISFPQEGAPHTGLYVLMIRATKVDVHRNLNMRLIVEAYDMGNPQPNIFKRLQYNSRQMTMTKPADHPGVITCAAGSVDGNVHAYSGTGPATNIPLKPDITGYSGLYTSSMQKPFFGTSCAAPFITGCAALLWQQFPKAELVKEQLYARAIDFGLPGHDTSYGWGVVCLDPPSPVRPLVHLVSASRVQDVTNAGVSGFNFVNVITCEQGNGRKIFTSLYFLKPDGSPITASTKDLGVYVGKDNQLRVTSYIVPSTNDLAAFESWLFIPDYVAQYAGPDAITLIRVEMEDGSLLDVKRFATVKELKQL